MIHLDELLATVDVNRAWRIVEMYATMPRCEPDDVIRASDVIVAELAQAGIRHETFHAELFLSLPDRARVEVGGRVLPAKAMAFSASVPQGVESRLVYVPATLGTSRGSRLERSHDDQAARPEIVHGSIIVSDGFPAPAKVAEFEAKGAVAFVTVNPGKYAHWGSCTSVWGNPEYTDLAESPSIPVVSVNRYDGQVLIDAASSGGAAVVHTELRQGWVRQPIPVATIRGSGNDSDDFILLHGHYDSWDVGVGDNATGVAAMIEIARVLQERAQDLSRTVKIAWWPGHSTGKFAGSTWYADEFALELHDNCVAHLGCDGPGCRNATEYREVGWMAEASQFCRETIQLVTGKAASGERPHRGADYSFNSIGITGFFQQSSIIPASMRQTQEYYPVGACGGNIEWHTEDDRIELADKNNLKRDICVYLACVFLLATTPVLPFDWRAAVRTYIDSLSAYDSAAGPHVDLSDCLGEAKQLLSELDKFYVRLESGDISPEVTNRIIKRLQRLLIPADYTAVAQFRHDRALPTPVMNSLSNASVIAEIDPDTAKFTATELRRARNRVLWALREATAEVAGAGSSEPCVQPRA